MEVVHRLLYVTVDFLKIVQLMLKLLMSTI